MRDGMHLETLRIGENVIGLPGHFFLCSTLPRLTKAVFLEVLPSGKKFKSNCRRRLFAIQRPWRSLPIIQTRSLFGLTLRTEWNLRRF